MRVVGAILLPMICVLSFSALALCEEAPNAVTACQLKDDPQAYNHKLVRVTAFVSHDFEDFTLIDPTCPSWPAVWLEYGGTSKSGTIYGCGVTVDRQPQKELTVENVPIPLLENKQFREFDKLIQPPFRSGDHGAIVHATLEGRFFAGERLRFTGDNQWGGYGHMGCCSLLAIQEIISADTQGRDDLDYGASADQPNIEKTGCGFRYLTPVELTGDSIKAQQSADLGQSEWMFDEPRRVAIDAFARFANVDQKSIVGLKEARKTQGRAVYRWSPSRKGNSYMVVVSRPYWLSFYARDPQRVVWVIAAAYLSSCSENNSVTRIR